MCRGTQAHHGFSITNIYKVSMEITGINPLCTCVTVSASKSIEPLETAHIDVTMDTRRFVGHKSVTIRVSVGPQFVRRLNWPVQREQPGRHRLQPERDQIRHHRPGNNAGPDARRGIRGRARLAD